MKIKVKLKSLGVKPRRPKPETAKHEMNETRYPSLYLSHREMPSIADLKQGDKLSLVFRGEVSEKSSHDFNGEVSHNATIRLKEGAIGRPAAPKMLPAPRNTTEAIHESSKSAGGLGRILSDFNHMAVPEVP